ncbi:hypothetical protein GOP47_0018620 [Adiantum capillus-veneris]|uniref:Uncharacterized protein n=1 Tax=Adiantum capillus-veneris TaxID=13818 RepID=A0A9D4ZAW6_ADICA|nr:hypothetical protein GOP47_0018620 [Adiantum capillus-veneris]
MPIVTTPQSPFGPGPPKESFVWRPSTSEENTMFRLEGNTLESQGFFRTPLIQVIPASRGQNVGGPVSTSSFPMFNPMKSGHHRELYFLPITSGVSIPGTTSPSPTLGILKPSFDKTCTVQGPVLETFRPFLPFDFGASQLNIVDGMEEDNIMALSATPSNENISPEELRWQDYQAKKKDFTFVCKVCNHAGSLTPMPSSSEPPTSYDSPSSSSPTLPLSGNQNAVQFAPFMLGLSSAPAIVSSSRGSSNDGIATLSSPLRPYPLTEAQETNSDSKAIQPSSQTASMMCPEQVIAENPVVAPSLGTALTSYSSIPSHPSLQFGISSLPVTDKSFQTQSISLLASSKHVFQKTVIRMQARRHGSAKRDGPRVSFRNIVRTFIRYTRWPVMIIES